MAGLYVSLSYRQELDQSITGSGGHSTAINTGEDNPKQTSIERLMSIVQLFSCRCRGGEGRAGEWNSQWLLCGAELSAGLQQLLSCLGPLLSVFV